MKITMMLVIPLIVIIIGSTSFAEGITANEVVDNMISNYEKQMANINDVKIVSSSDVRYQKKFNVNGKPVFKTRTEVEIAGKKIISIYDGQYLWSYNPLDNSVNKEEASFNPQEMVHGLKNANLVYGGKETVDNNSAHVLKVSNLDMMMGAEQKEGVNGKIWVDAKDWVIRKMEVEIVMGDEDYDEDDVPPTASIRMKDYRNVKGMLIPYVTEIAFGSMENIEMTPEEREEMEQNIAEMERELEQMPAIQKRFAEKAMRAQINLMRNLLEGQGLVTKTEISDVKVNTGLADDLFDGNRLGK